jgi:hypothetical protein
MAIQMVKIRAEISVGSLRAGTPSLGHPNHILSFNVDKSRGQISTFSASLKVQHGEISGNIVGDSIQISSGENSPSNRIFTGIIRSANITPCRDDPLFVILNVSGNDALSRLDGKKYTRRCRSTKGTWVAITQVTRPGLRSGKLAYLPLEPTIEPWGGDVEKKDNVTVTRGINWVDTDKLPGDKQTLPIVFEVSPAEMQ